MTDDIDRLKHTVHNLFTAGIASSPDGPVHIMMYARRREPLSDGVGSDINPWVSYHIETFNPRTRDHIAYAYIPKEYMNSPVPEEVGERKTLDSHYAEAFQNGLTFWQNAGRENTLTRADIAELRYYVQTARYDDTMTQKMVNRHKLTWPKSYMPGEKPQEPGWKKGLR